MFEPIRGGTRGGQTEFKWSDVSADKDREHYLGHSINAPTGRWQKNKDVHWYNREAKQTEEERQAEIRKVKEAEAEAMSQVLGFAPTKKPLGVSEGSPTAGPSGDMSHQEDEVSKEKQERRLRKLEKRAKKAEKKARKEAKRMVGGERGDSDSDSERDDRHRDRRRSLSPRRRDNDERGREYSRRRSASPSRTRRRSASPPPRREARDHADYDFIEQERERERDRRRWDVNATRDLPRGYRPR